MTTSQFAQQVKAKYPEYQDIPDDQLTQQIIQKYPQYKSQVLPATQSDPTTFGSALPSNGSKAVKKPTGNPVYDALKSNPISNFLLGQAGNVAQDVGTGLRGIMEQGNLQKTEQQAQQLEQQAQQTQDPQQKKSLLMQANQIRQGITSEAGNIANSFSPDVNQNPVSRGVGAAIQIGNAVALPDTIASIPKVVGGVLHPIQTLGALRNSLLGDAAVPTDTLSSEITSKLNPKYFDTAQAPVQAETPNQISHFVRSLNPITTAGQNEATQAVTPATTKLSKIFENLPGYESGARAYGPGGETPSADVSQAANFTSRAARDFIKSEAPKAAGAIRGNAANTLTDIMHMGYLAGKNWKTIAKLAGVGGTGFAGAELYNLLFGKHN